MAAKTIYDFRIKASMAFALVENVIAGSRAQKGRQKGMVFDADLAAVWWGLGDFDKAFYYIGQCIEKRRGPVSYFLEYPAYKGIKDDPRYAEIRKKQELDRVM